VIKEFNWSSSLVLTRQYAATRSVLFSEDLSADLCYCIRRFVSPILQVNRFSEKQKDAYPNGQRLQIHITTLLGAADEVTAPFRTAELYFVTPS